MEIEKSKNALENGKTLVEELLEKQDIDNLNIYVTSKKMISILYNKNKLNLITNCYDGLLFTPVGEIIEDKSVSSDTVFLEYMLDKGFNPLSKSFGISNDKVIKVLCDKGYYEFLGEKLDSKKLLIKLDDGTTLIDKLLQNNCNINFKYGGFEEEEIASK